MGIDAGSSAALSQASIENGSCPVSIEQVLSSRTWRVLFMKYSKKRFTGENINFLTAAVVEKKLNRKTYDRFISDSAAEQVNLPFALFQTFHGAIRTGNLLTTKNWEEAVKEIKKVVRRNDLGAGNNFSNWFAAGCKA